MTLFNNYLDAAPHHRQNRRRERPGSRTRRTISRKSLIQSTIQEGILDARDSNVPLPSDKARPSPLLRQNFDQSWQRWKARQAEEAAATSLQKLQLEEQRVLLFGGELDDDDLYQSGVLFTAGIEQQDANLVLCDVSVRQEAPMFVMRPSRRSRRRQPKWHNLSLFLSFSDLSENADIARLLSPANMHNTPTIQHRNHIPSTQASIIDIEIPLSLPPPIPAFSSFSSSISGSDLLENIILTNSPTLVQEGGEDWTFITTNHTRNDSTPSSEPETWSLCDDS